MPKNVARKGPVIDFSNVGKSESLTSVAMKILDIFEAEVSRDPTEWIAIFERAASLLEQVNKKQSAERERSLLDGKKLGQASLEQIYFDLQGKVIEIRLAVARAIAGEQQFQREVEKLKTAEGTWQLRAEQAELENNPELAKQAKERMEGYRQSIAETAEALANHSQETLNLRQRLTEIETVLQQTRSAKQILLTREDVANSVLRAKKLLQELNSDLMNAVLQQAKARVVEKEAEAAAMETGVNINASEMPAERLALTIENVNTVLQALKKFAEEKDAPE